MSALGQKQTYAVQKGMSALHPIATAKADLRKTPCRLYANSRHCALFGQFVSALLENFGDRKAKWELSGASIQRVQFGRTAIQIRCLRLDRTAEQDRQTLVRDRASYDRSLGVGKAGTGGPLLRKLDLTSA
jgi:hypothetical protein